jgi:SNF family Na+-dependent transporter
MADDDDQEKPSVTSTLVVENPRSISFETRDQWTNKFEYMLSVIGYVVDLGNCVRFPYITYKNGGGAFLIPYTIFLLLIGTPMMYLEMSVGQYHRKGNITLWSKINPYMKGIGIASLLVVCYITLYYATIIAHAVFYLFASFREILPWTTCDNYWNTAKCTQRIDLFKKSNRTIEKNGTHTSPSEEYYNLYMLKIQSSNGIDDLGGLKLDLVLCLAAVYLLMYVCIYKGVKSTGKAVYITAVLPYLILIVLLFRAVTLEGASIGLYYFIKPTFEELLKFQCWKDAAIQIFFTLGPGISVLTTYASYSKFENNCQIDAIVASIANVIASFLAGLTVFASLGHLSLLVDKPISEVAQDGMGLSFIAYPEILSALPASTFFSIVFFLMIINLGLDSAFGGLEAIYTALADEFHVVRMNRKFFMISIHFLLFICSLPTVTYGGNYLVTFLDSFATSPALMLIVFCEAVTVTWIYGLDKFDNDLRRMMGFRANFYWKICWKFICPLIIFVLFIVSIYFFERPTMGSYEYPTGYIIFGWVINCSVMLPIPAYILYKFFSNKFCKSDINLRT